jgi:hypothetical protein
MALRIAVGLFAALRAVLIYGEAGTLASQPLDLPRTAPPWGWSPGAEPPVQLGVR